MGSVAPLVHFCRTMATVWGCKESLYKWSSNDTPVTLPFQCDWIGRVILYLVGGLEHGSYFPIYLECHHPNWRTLMFLQRYVITTNQILTIINHHVPMVSLWFPYGFPMDKRDMFGHLSSQCSVKIHHTVAHPRAPPRSPPSPGRPFWRPRYRQGGS